MAILLPAAVLGAAARDAASAQATIAAEGAPIPILYGRVRRGALLFAATVLDGALVLGCIWGVGPIDAVESIEIDDAAPHASVVATHYLGTPTQGVDPTLAAAIPGYADTLVASVDSEAIGIAYSVLRIPARLGSGWPRVAAVLRGRAVWDPRSNLITQPRVAQWAPYLTADAAGTAVERWEPGVGWVLRLTKTGGADSSLFGRQISVPGLTGAAVCGSMLWAAVGSVGTARAVRVGASVSGGGSAVAYAESPMTGPTGWSRATATATASLAGGGTYHCWVTGPVGASADFALPQVEIAAASRGYVDGPAVAGARWSRNPALIAGDLLASGAYGQGLTVSDTDLGLAAAVCDEVLADGLPRRALDLALDAELPAAQWADVLAGYAGCFLAREGAAVRLVPDRPASPTRTLTAADVVDGSLRLRQRAQRETPTVVRVEWTDTTTTPWRTREAVAQLAGVDLGTVPRREDRVSLPGITSYSQAHREAIERLAAGGLPLEVEFQTFDAALADQRGDVVTLTHPVGLSAQPLRLTDVRLSAPGRWAISARQYAATVYSDAVPADPAAVPAGLPGDATVSAPAAVLLDALAVEVAADGTLRAPVGVRWLASPDPYLAAYDVELRIAGGPWQALAALSADRLDALGYAPPGAAVDARVRAVSATGIRSAWTLSSASAAEKLTPPADVQGLAWDGAALAWSRLADADLAGYLVRWQQGRRTTWADAIPMHDGVVGDTPWRPLRRPTGPATVLVCGVDSSGNVSRIPAVLALDLPAAVLANVLFAFNFGTAAWPGSIVGASVSGGVVSADSTVAYWTGDSLPAWTYDSDPAWPAAAYAALTYTAEALRLPVDVLGERVTLAAAVDGETWTIEYRWDSPGPYWTRDTEAAWTDDAAPVWGYGDWQPWPGEVQARAEALELRVRCGAGTTQGALSALVLSVDTPDRTAVVAGVALAAGGSRVPLPAPAWRVLRAVVGTLYGTGTAATVRVLDRDAGAGPLVQAFDSAGTAVAAVADFHLTGY
ncbi:hypothetical protein [Plasticicumulans sp.]|uniref:hypothetical protein n=1 Tax=Plasticicumulans sp. TaxID=2307179 RepID=UPI00321FC467